MSQHHAAAELPAIEPVTIGRYLLHRQIARGGMATIHIARLLGDEGFTRIVAAKRLLPQFAEDADFVAMFLDEAQIASKVHHRNVVPVLDLVNTGDEVILVQEYIHGVPLHSLLATARAAKLFVPPDIASSIACQVLAGLHATHETTDEVGAPLHIVHRDVSPQNVMIAVDGTARLLDFGVAKGTMTAHVTRDGYFKGKLAYAAPEALRGVATRQSDVFSLAVMLWEIVVGHRMHELARSEPELIAAILTGVSPSLDEAFRGDRDPVGADRWLALEALQPIIRQGLAVELADRWATAAAMEAALTSIVRPAAPSEVAAWMKTLGKDFMEGRDKVLAAEEVSWRASTTARAHVHAVTSEVTPTVAPEVALTPLPSQRRSTIVHMLGALAAGLVIAIVVLVAARKPQLTVSKPPPAPAITPVVEQASMPAQWVTPPAAIVTPVVKSPVARPTPLTTKRAISVPVVRPRPVVVQPVAPPVERPITPPPNTACTPPYYFEGRKKIFKPSCL